jgi:hypothetical protein
MTTSQPASHLVVRSARLGALGFGIGFAVAWPIAAVLSRQAGGWDVTLLPSALLYACAGALGGAALAQGVESLHRSPLFPLAGALGCGLGFYAMGAFGSVWPGEYWVVGSLALDVAYTLLYAAVGALTGALLGVAQHELRRTALLTLAGALGFGLFYLFHYLVFLINRIGIVPGTSGDIWNDLVGVAIVAFVWGAVGGGLAGACLGIGNSWRAAARPVAHALHA